VPNTSTSGGLLNHDEGRDSYRWHNRPPLSSRTTGLTGTGSCIVQNAGDTAVFLGGEAVSASGAAAGLSLAAGATLTVPGGGPLYGIVASGTGTVAFLAA
jgi:hypothetical protein